MLGLVVLDLEVLDSEVPVLEVPDLALAPELQVAVLVVSEVALAAPDLLSVAQPAMDSLEFLVDSVLLPLVDLVQLVLALQREEQPSVQVPDISLALELAASMQVASQEASVGIMAPTTDTYPMASRLVTAMASEVTGPDSTVPMATVGQVPITALALSGAGVPSAVPEASAAREPSVLEAEAGPLEPVRLVPARPHLGLPLVPAASKQRTSSLLGLFTSM